ncbi:transglutaminase TgpA family protein [Actinosynnema sp. CS-041913]|uniref:transglutaminase TgpA family protein n=1 Tax=Actinosynnema sp. CS-041913 TaxID=3239917 RepID=UPI003D94812F
MTAPVDRLAVVGLLGSTAVAGLLFAPVFGLAALLVPVLVVVLVGYGCVELCARRPRLTPYRPVLLLFTGVLGLIEAVLFPTTVAGLPTAASLRGIQRGLTEGWLLTLQSTWPARPDPDQLLFVPLAVLLATVLGVEILLRLRTPAVALLPGLAVAGLAQAYQASTGGTALLAAACYAGPAALLLWADRPSRTGPRGTGTRPGLPSPTGSGDTGPRSGRPGPTGPRGTGRRLSDVDIRSASATVVAVVVCGIVVGGFDPVGREPYRVKDDQAVPLRQQRVGNPLQEIAQRLADPEREVFRYRADAPVDRWSLVVLDGFDGVNWSADTRLSRLGARRDGAAGSVTRTADVVVEDLPGPWLPSQAIPLGVDGLAPLVDQSDGTLLLAGPGDRRYRLTWSEPEIDAAALGVGPVDPEAGGLDGLGVVPAEIGPLARDAVRGLRPTFQSALQLERYLARNYRLAVGDDLPTGHGWPQLRHFLTESRRGTSEQFAAAYVALARMNGIPARLVVGYRGGVARDGSYVVRNRDVLAWPEVAVAGVGWVPMDPTAAAGEGRSGPAPSGLAKAAAQAREQLPPEHELRPPEQPKRASSETPAADVDLWFAAVAAAVALLGLLICWLVGVPVAKALRAGRRRRRTGAEGVIAAWAELCDRLRAHGVPFRIGMTPRDLAESAAPVIGEPAAQAIARLGRVLDMALWSGVPVADGSVRRAWEEERAVRRGLAGRPLSARLRAAVDPRPLLRPSVDPRSLLLLVSRVS